MIRQEDNDIVIDGWEQGITDNPYEGIYDMRNCDPVTIPGEVSVALKTQRTDTLNTAITNVAFTVDNATDVFTYSGTPTLLVNTAIRFTNSDGALPAGLDTTQAYYIKTTPTPTTFTIATSAGGTQKLVTDDGSGTNTFTVINMGIPTEIKPLNTTLIELGDFYQGGYVFYLLQNGDTGYDPTVQKGLVVSPDDVSAGVYWHATDDTSVATDTALGTGQANTTAILTAYGGESNAAKACDDYAGGSFTPWYLPSKDELAKLYLNRSIVGITTGTYWSSSQSSASQAYAQSFSTGVAAGVNKSSTQPVRAIHSFTSSVPPTNGQSSYFAVDNNGRVWIYQAGVTDYWIYLNNLASELVTSTYNNIATWKNYLFLFSGTSLSTLRYSSLLTMSLKASWYLNWKVVAGVNIHQALVGQDDVLYFCNGDKIGSILETIDTTTGFPNTFSPYGLTTYTFNNRALSLPSTDSSTCLAELGQNLMIGGENNFIYPWDRVSPNFSFPIFLSENYTTRMVTINTSMYIFCGYNGRIFITNGANATPFFKIPEYLSKTTNPYIVWKDANFNRNQLYFGFACTNNAGTTINEYGGLWAVDVDSASPVSPRLQNQLSYGTYSGYVSAICQFRGTARSIAPSADGYGMFVGWYSGTSGGIDKGISTPYAAGESYIECDPFAAGTFLIPKTIESVQFKLGTPLVTGESVALYYRLNIADSYTQMPITQGNEVGDISGIAYNNFQNAQWIQIKVVLTSTATNPSFVRLREIRLH